MTLMYNKISSSVCWMQCTHTVIAVKQIIMLCCVTLILQVYGLDSVSRIYEIARKMYFSKKKKHFSILQFSWSFMWRNSRKKNFFSWKMDLSLWRAIINAECALFVYKIHCFLLYGVWRLRMCDRKFSVYTENGRIKPFCYGHLVTASDFHTRPLDHHKFLFNALPSTISSPMYQLQSP